MPIIIVQAGENRAGLVLGEPAIIGRSRLCPLFLDVQGVSRQHAQLDVVGGQWTITDLDSTNGTCVNRHLIDRPHVLQDGDLIKMGQAVLTYLNRPELPAGLQPLSESGAASTTVENDPRPAAANAQDVLDRAVLAQRRTARREAARKRREAAGKARQAAVKASQSRRPAQVSPAAAAAESALARALSNAQQDAETAPGAAAGPVVWRYLSTEAKPVDDWATGRKIAAHSHFTPYCQPETDDELLGDDTLTAAPAGDACPDDPVDSDSTVGDMLLLLACFVAFPLGLMMSGLPNLLVILAATIYKVRRRQRFSNGILALVIALSLVGLAAGAFRAAQSWLGVAPAP